MTEEEADIYDFKCPKCGHRWKVSAEEWVMLSLATGKSPRCPKCNSGRVLWQAEHSAY